MKESCFNVKLMYVPIEQSGDVENDSEGFKASSGSGSFVIVHTILLCKAFGDVPYFVPSYVSIFIPFPFADQFAFQRALTRGYV